MNISANIKTIIKESYIWRKRDILEGASYIPPILSVKALIKSNLLIFIAGILFSIFFGSFFNTEFAGYAITALSIFIGLFTTILILIFDKFVNNPITVNDKISDELKLNLIRTKNFSRQFVFVSLEGLLIAICIIILFLIPLMFGNSFTTDILKYEIVFDDLKCYNILIFVTNIIIIFTRIFLVIFLFKFFKYLFFIFGSLGIYMKGVFDNNVKI